MPTWAQVGHALWVDLHFERDFFICKPSKDLEGMRPIQASYCDRMRLGRLVLQGLLQEEPGGGGGTALPAAMGGGVLEGAFRARHACVAGGSAWRSPWSN